MSTCPAPTKRIAPVAGSSSTSAAVTYFSGAVDAKSSSLACSASSGSDAVRPSRARSVACMLLITSAAGRPLPETSATHSSRRASAASPARRSHRSSRRRTGAPADCAPPDRSRRSAGSSAGNRSAWMRAASVELALELGARHFRLLVQRQQPLALVAPPAWSARTAARSRSRSPSAAPACSAA